MRIAVEKSLRSRSNTSIFYFKTANSRRKEIAVKFDPNAAAAKDSGIFGVPCTEKKAALVLLPVPWDATTSYHSGTARGPSAILAASHFVDLFHLGVVDPYKAGIYMLPVSKRVLLVGNAEAKALATKVIDAAGNVAGNPILEESLARVNELGKELNEFVFTESRRVLTQRKILGVMGGDHSVPLGAIRAMGKSCSQFGILHIDAHSDTRNAFEGFTFSHASIMRNVLNMVPQVTRLVQVGIRDLCEEEVAFCSSQGERVHTFYDRSIRAQQFEGRQFGDIVCEIIALLPPKVWISFDVDGMDPRFCPHTGTPVPGGFDFNEICFLLKTLVENERIIIGFDLNEVAPSKDEADDWDANVGARLLYELCAWTIASQGKCKVRR